MGKEGQLIILATGSVMTDVFSAEADENPFNAGCTVVPDAYQYADCRASQTKQNNQFTAWVAEALHEGRDIVLITPRGDMLDKRLRDSAIVFSLPERDDESSLG